MRRTLWAELAQLRTPQTWAKLLHGEKKDSSRGRELRKLFLEFEDEGLAWFCPRMKTWNLTDKGRKATDIAC